MIDQSDVLPPGQGPLDPVDKSLDPVAFALDRVRVYLIWIDEHRASFEANKSASPDLAERELRNLEAATTDARRHMGRLLELVLAGYGIDPSKRLPEGLSDGKQTKALTTTQYALRHPSPLAIDMVTHEPQRSVIRSK